MVHCPVCGHLPEIDYQYGSVYTAYCHFCRETYCAMCKAFPDHFPASCADRTEWKQRYINRTNEVYVVLNAVRNLNQQRFGMLAYREIIGDNLYDHHPHISLAVDEMRRILSILAWTRVIAFINPNLAILDTLEYTNLEDRFNALHDQFLHNIENNGDFDLADARRVAVDSVVQLLGRLQSRPVAGFHHAVHIPQLLGHEVDFNQNLSRIAELWALLPRRRI